MKNWWLGMREALSVCFSVALVLFLIFFDSIKDFFSFYLGRPPR